jgi:hypothetical protein
MEGQTMTKEQNPKQTPAERFKGILETMEQEQKTRQDIVTPLKSIVFNPDSSLSFEDGRQFKLGANTFENLCSFTNIPASYAARLMNDKPELLAEQFNFYLKQDGTKKMFRVKNDRVQGIVSPKYSAFDNFHVLETLWHKWNDRKEIPDFEVTNFHEVDSIMHMRIMFPELEQRFGVSNEDGQVDIGRVAIDFGNSEVGTSRIRVNGSVFRQVCSNGLKTWKSNGRLEQKHIYLNFEETVININRLTENSIEEGKVLLNRMQELKTETVELPYALLERLGKEFGLKEKAISRLKENYLFEDEHTMFGVVNAFTRFARDVEEKDNDNDLRQRIEQYAGDMLMVG